MKRMVMSLVAAFVSGASAAAADREGRFALDGGGAAACAQFLQAREAKAAELSLFAGWIDGYLSAVNQMRPETYDITPWQTTDLLLVLVENYCRANPKEAFGLAVNRLGAALAKDRMTTQSPMMVAGHKGAVVSVYEEIIVRVHGALVERKHLPKEAEPKFTPEMRVALEKFQQERKIPVTGLPDQKTLFLLFLPDPKAAPPAGK